MHVTVNQSVIYFFSTRGDLKHILIWYLIDPLMWRIFCPSSGYSTSGGGAGRYKHIV